MVKKLENETKSDGTNCGTCQHVEGKMCKIYNQPRKQVATSIENLARGQGQDRDYCVVNQFFGGSVVLKTFEDVVEVCKDYGNMLNREGSTEWWELGSNTVVILNSANKTVETVQYGKVGPIAFDEVRLTQLLNGIKNKTGYYVGSCYDTSTSTE